MLSHRTHVADGLGIGLHMIGEELSVKVSNHRLPVVERHSLRSPSQKVPSTRGTEVSVVEYLGDVG